MADSQRLPPPPFWRTLYYALHVMGRPGRRIDPIEIRRTRWVAARGSWLRVVTEADGETVHNAFWDRDFEP